MLQDWNSNISQETLKGTLSAINKPQDTELEDETRAIASNKLGIGQVLPAQLGVKKKGKSMHHYFQLHIE